MNKPQLYLLLLLILPNYLISQDYAAFEKPIVTTVLGNHSFFDKEGKECILESKSEIEILGRGYYKYKGKYWIKTKDCSGFISFAWFFAGAEFREQDNKAARLIYELKNAKALKEIKEEKEASLKAEKEKEFILKNECAYTINEVDIFDKVKIVRTSAKWIVGGLHIELYSKGGKKKVIFSAIDLGCTSPYKNNRSWVKVMLENDDVITFYHSGNLDCGGFELWGNISNSEIARLKQSPVKAIKMEGTEYNHTITDLDWPTFFIDQLKCYNPE